MARLLFVDFENVPKVDLSALPDDVVVPFFFGASQRSVPTAFLKDALKLGSRFVPIDIEGQGKNALDFHIAFYLGEYLRAEPAAECVILSRDKGFDPLVRHLAGRGFKVRRVGVIGDAYGAAPTAAASTGRTRPPRTRRSHRGTAGTATSAATSTARPAKAPVVPALSAPVETATDLERARAQLRRMPARNLPRRRPRLAAMLDSYFAQKLDAKAIEALIEALIADGAVHEAGGALSYPKG